MNRNIISINHGSGGGMSRELIDNLFKKYFCVLVASTCQTIIFYDLAGGSNLAGLIFSVLLSGNRGNRVGYSL